MPKKWKIRFKDEEIKLADRDLDPERRWRETNTDNN